jgi:hypothetical protein
MHAVPVLLEGREGKALLRQAGGALLSRQVARVGAAVVGRVYLLGLGVYTGSLYWEFILGVYTGSLYWEFIHGVHLRKCEVFGPSPIHVRRLLGQHLLNNIHSPSCSCFVLPCKQKAPISFFARKEVFPFVSGHCDCMFM